MGSIVHLQSDVVESCMYKLFVVLSMALTVCLLKWTGVGGEEPQLFAPPTSSRENSRKIIHGNCWNCWKLATWPHTHFLNDLWWYHLAGYFHLDFLRHLHLWMQGLMITKAQAWFIENHHCCILGSRITLSTGGNNQKYWCSSFNGCMLMGLDVHQH